MSYSEMGGAFYFSEYHLENDSGRGLWLTEHRRFSIFENNTNTAHGSLSYHPQKSKPWQTSIMRTEDLRTDRRNHERKLPNPGLQHAYDSRHDYASLIV